jgi:putative oxidoreductase
VNMRIALPSFWTKMLRWLLGALFLWAAVSKLANPTEFLGSVYAYQFPLPRGWLKFAAVVLPWVELLTALMLLAGFWLEAALSLTFLLLSVFFLGTGQAWLRGLSISCGCFDLNLVGLGNAENLKKVLESVGFAFVRNGLLAGLSFFLLRDSIRQQIGNESEVVQAGGARPRRHESANKRRARRH